MNCKRYQQRILDYLAAGEVLPQEVSVHRNACAACREFHLIQQNLFHAVDAGLRSIANQPVPLSLLSGLRVRLEENHDVSNGSIPGLSFALLTAALVLALFVAFGLHRPGPAAPQAESNTIRPQPVAKPDSSAQTASKPPGILTEHRIQAIAPHGSQAVSPEPEVIVLADERKAYSKYLAAAPEKRDVPLLPALPVQPVSDDSQEIALVRIDSLELPPLQGAADK